MSMSPLINIRELKTLECVLNIEILISSDIFQVNIVLLFIDFISIIAG